MLLLLETMIFLIPALVRKLINELLRYSTENDYACWIRLCVF